MIHVDPARTRSYVYKVSEKVKLPTQFFTTRLISRSYAISSTPHIMTVMAVLLAKRRLDAMGLPANRLDSSL
ncbi:hypothetical protein P692DRAFT_20731409 [Suillus brevipes Sb2]|nr:hypothetical protein P692DRAFT_20731409 [Suillus brevipes Sb2]